MFKTHGQADSIISSGGLTIAISTYNSHKLLFASYVNDREVQVDSHSIQRAMGVDFKNDQLVVASSVDIRTFDRQNAELFIPQYTRYTGFRDTHELAIQDNGDIYYIDTLASVICKLDFKKRFNPWWRPAFITELVDEDRCHLNGMTKCLSYATAFSRTNTDHGWRGHLNGVIIDIDTDKIICSGLQAPHSPRIHNGQLYVLESGTGSLINMSTQEVITKLPGFARGLDIVGDIAFVGTSKLREKGIFDLTKIKAIPENERICGVYMVDLKSSKILGCLEFTHDVTELFDIKVIHP